MQGPDQAPITNIVQFFPRTVKSDDLLWYLPNAMLFLISNSENDFLATECTDAREVVCSKGMRERPRIAPSLSESLVAF